MKDCIVRGCKKPGKDAGGMCGMHAQRVRRYGDHTYVTPRARWLELCRLSQPTLGKCKPTTYKKLHQRHEHRVVAEQMLGRKLTRREIVHHKDGNIHNNHPSNLQVMTQSQHMSEHREDLLAGKRRAAALRGRG